MMTGLVLILMGITILFYPQILVLMISGFLIAVGLGIVAVSWQFRRLRRQSQSRFVNWIIRW